MATNKRANNKTPSTCLHYTNSSSKTLSMPAMDFAGIINNSVKTSVNFLLLANILIT